jgi:L-fuculose-phosphate aldolase
VSRPTPPGEPELRRQIVETCRRMNALRINQGTSGNASARIERGLLLTPTSLPYEEMAEGDIVVMRSDGSYEGDRLPSTEWRFHLDIMNRRPEVAAIVHAHPTFATTIAIMGRDIPALHYMVAAAGGSSIRCAPYATFGTAELSANALKALEGRSACLLAHHGMIATGPDLERALWLAVEVETLARQYYYTLALGGPPLLPDDEIERVRQKMRNYGPPPKAR